MQTLEESIELLGSLLAPRRAILRHRIAFAFVEGPRFVLDPRHPHTLEPGFSRDCDLTMLLNRQALHDWMSGALDPEDPKPGQVLLWAGDVEALRELSRSLDRSGRSIDVRARAMQGGGR